LIVCVWQQAKKEALERSAAAFRKLLSVERCLRPYEGLVSVQVASNVKENLRQALTRAGEAMRKWPRAPRAYAMMGSVLASPLVKDQAEKARQAYKKAVELGNQRNPSAPPDPDYLIHLADLCLLEAGGRTREQGIQEALQLLTTWGARTDSLALNLKLGEVLCLCADASHHHDAVETYQRALAIDPHNRAAKKGLSAYHCFPCRRSESFASSRLTRAVARSAVACLDNVERMMQGLEPEDGDETADDETINNSETDEVEGDQGY
jgi:tetratricopeptide (TPR) repeat protein